MYDIMEIWQTEAALYEVFVEMIAVCAHCVVVLSHKTLEPPKCQIFLLYCRIPHTYISEVPSFCMLEERKGALN